MATLGGSSLYVWVVTAYLVPATVSLPIYARLSDRHGRRALLLIGMVLFLAGSALAATAQDMDAADRAGGRCRASGPGALEGLSFILVADLFAGRRSAALQGALAGLMGISFIAGPLVGGFLTDHVGWRVGVHREPADRRSRRWRSWRPCCPPSHRAQRAPRRRRSTCAGIALLTLAVGLLLVGLDERTHADAAALPGWIEPDRRADRGRAARAGRVRRGRAPRGGADHPARPARPTAAPARSWSPGATGAFGLFAGALLLPRYFQTVRDVSATHSGLLIYPLLLGLVVVGQRRRGA